MKKRYSIVILLLIICIGVIFSGCSPDYSSLSLSLRNAEKIELSVTDEKVDYYLVVNNYFDFNASFSFDFAERKAKIVENSIEHKGNGVFKFSIAPIMAGNTTLKITLKGTDKYINVPVIVKKQVESISALTNIFVKKGSSLTINNAMFTFDPVDTTENGLSYSLLESADVNYEAEGVAFNTQTNTLSVASTCSLQSVTLQAVSTYDANIKTNLVVKVVQEIDTSSLQLQIASQDIENSNPNAFGDYSPLELQPQEPYTLVELVKSDEYNYQKKISLSYALFNQGYNIQISSSEKITLGGEDVNSIIRDQNSDFILSANDFCTGRVTIRIFQVDLPENFAEVYFDVKVTYKPKNITINGQLDIGLQELYTNSSVVKEYKFGVAPDKANKDDYSYTIGFYQSATETLTNNFDDDFTELTYSKISEFIDIKYGGVDITSSDLGKLASSLKVKALKSTNDKYLAVKITCFDNETEICNQVLLIKVYVGTTEFKIRDIYEDGTIYMALADGPQIFYGIKYSDGSTPGKLSITSTDITKANICDIAQVSTATANLEITPKSVGEQEFLIVTANELSVKLKVVVFREITENDFVLQIADTSNDYVASFKPKDTNLSLEELTIKGLNSSVNLQSKIQTDYSDYNSYSYSYELSLTAKGYEYFSITNNSRLTSLKFTRNYDKDTNKYTQFNVPLSVNLNINTIDKNETNYSFKMKSLTLTKDFTIDLYCVNYIKQMTLYASKELSGGQQTRIASIYNKGDLSYINQNLATVYLFMDLVQSEVDQYSLLDISKFEFKSGAELFKLTGTNTIKVGEIGTFYPSSEVDEYGCFATGTNGYIGSFTYDYNSLRTLSSISITLKVTDSNVGKDFSSAVTLNVEEYVDVESIWLSTPEDVIYLDNTQTYYQKSISVQVLPANAMCPDLDVKIETKNTNCIGVDIKDGTITFTFQSSGSGQILIFPISKMKTNSYLDEYGEYYYHLTLNFVCADGKTEQTARKISTLQDLKTIEPNKHYYIDSTINCQGEVLDLQNLTSGSIRGTFEYETNDDGSPNELFANAQQIGSIVNFKVNVNDGNNLGLFRVIGENAKVYNLSLSGVFANDISLSSSANLGILCGTNKGLVKNVSISLEQANNVNITNNKTETSITVNMGLVAGVNEGQIIVDENCKDYTLLAYNTDNTLLTVNFVASSGTQITSYLGGIVGENKGKLQQNLALSFITIGLYGMSANIFIDSNANYVAGAVGYNSGTISGLKVSGEVKGFTSRDDAIANTSKFTAGFVGYASGGNILNNISRVFVRGKQVVSGFVGEIAISKTTTFSSNKVQATDSGKRQGINSALIVAYGDSSEGTSTAKTFASNVLNGVEVETYFDRTLPIDLISILNEKAISYTSGLNINLTERDITYQTIDSLDYNNYYGEMIILDKDFKSVIYLDYQSAFTRGEEDNISPADLISNFILSAYMQAEDSNNQIYIDNKLDTKSLLEYVNIIKETSTIKELNIEILSPSTARVVDFGKNITILNVGELNIIISSSLNYKNKANLNLYITNYYEDIKIYSDKSKTEEITTIQLCNKQITTVYLGLFSNSYNYKNTPIKLANNNEISFKMQTPSTLYNVEILGQTLYLSSLGDDINNFTSNLTLITMFALNNNFYFKDTSKYISSETGDYKLYGFVTDATNYDIRSYEVKAVASIEGIKLSKSIIEVEPSDSIEIDVTYMSYNSADKIVPVLRVYESQVDNIYKEYTLDSATSTLFTDDYNRILFKLSYTGAELQSNGKYLQKFVLKMPIDSDFDIDVYNYLLGKHIELTFKSELASSQSATLVMQYKAETISSVLINNYNGETNEGMVVTTNNVRRVEVDKMLYSGKQASIGEMNVLNAYIYTKLSEFDYVDVTMQLGSEGGYLGYLEYSDDNTYGLVSNSAVYTSITTGCTIRIYKEDIKADKINNYLVLGIIYKIPTTISNNTIVPIVYTFYSKNHEPFVETINVLAKIVNQVSFEIVDKQVVEEVGDVKVYNVARGVTYLLNPIIVGFDESDAVFESSNSSVASINKQGNGYYLNISDVNINYGDSEYYEVIIRSYGKQSNSTSLGGVVKVTKLHIYEVLVDSEKLFGEDNIISLRMLDIVDVRNNIVNKIDFEYARFNSRLIDNFKQSFLNNAKFYFVDENGREYKLENGLTLITDDYTLKCYNSSEDLKFEFKPLKTGEPCNYGFKAVYLIVYNKGVPAVDVDDELTNMYEKSFVINTHIATTGDNPAPIFTYADMLNMSDGEYYRQVEDITIKASELKMITASPKLFDGNGHKITITSGTVNVELDSSSDFALFKLLNEDCIIQNVSIVVSGNLNLTLNNNISTSGANISILVAENNGIITNCSIKSENVVMVDIISVIAVMEQSYFASLCARNTGYITNCQIECNLTARGASLAGVVADNSGYIASTYIKNSRIYNTTSTTSESIVTGGFVCSNSGTITMCYVEGAVSSNKIYSDYTAGDYSLSSKIIYTATKSAGFVYENMGQISDCYSNIPLVSSNESSGFVAKAQSGKITRVFSLSKLKQQDTLNFGFVSNYNKEESLFEDCFFIIQEGFINYNTSTTNYTVGTDGKFISAIEGIEPLGIADFNPIDKTTGEIKESFKPFIVDSENASHGVWFYAFDTNKDKTTAFEFNTYSCEVYGLEDQNNKARTFTARRLHLVSPNIITYSKEELVVDSESGEYSYEKSKDVEAKGSRTNPYIISTAKEFEEYCYYNSSSEYKYYRLICDINYADEDIYVSNLYTKVLVGYFDGNGLSINNYSVNSIVSNLTAGLFAQIGLTGAIVSCVKNTTFVPAYVNLPNCIYVGGIAGTLANANIYNVSIDAPDVIVVGSNMVGGMFGRTAGENNIALTYSNISAKASTYNSLALKNVVDMDNLLSEITLKSTGENKTKVSYSGAIVGYVDGVTNIHQVSVGENARTLGMISGLMFGSIGSVSKVYDFQLTLNSFENQIVAYAFGGYVAGVISGVVDNFSINSNIINYNMFSCHPITPVALGGVAGLANNATISNMTSSEGYSIIGAKIIGKDLYGYLNMYNPYYAKYVGGVVGYSNSATIENVSICNESGTQHGLALMGGNYVGGVIGYVSSKSNGANNKIVLGEIKVNLIGEKEYQNADEQTALDKIYFSHISSATGEDITIPDMSQKIGLLLNYDNKITIEKKNASDIAEAAKGIMLVSSSNRTISLGTNILYAYADYIIDLSVGNVNATMGNLVEASFKSNNYYNSVLMYNYEANEYKVQLRATNLKTNEKVVEDLAIN